MIPINSLLNLKFFCQKIFRISEILWSNFLNLGNFVEDIRVSRYARPAKTGIKYLFRRYSRRGRGRGTVDKTDNIETQKKKQQWQLPRLPTSSTMSILSGWLAVSDDSHSAEE